MAYNTGSALQPLIHFTHIFEWYLAAGRLSLLNFKLAADIVSTIISPTITHLVELGAIAAIRTFLNYFLSKELKEEREITRKTVDVKKEVVA